MDLYKMKKEALRRGYSPKTIRTYSTYISKFLMFCRKDLKKIRKKDISDYLDNLYEEGKSYSTMNLALSSLKYFAANVLKRSWHWTIKYSKVKKKLPLVLSKKEVLKLLDTIENTKHWLILALMYSGGLRVSEAAKLKVEDIELERGYGWVRNGKGGKDRMFLVAETVKPLLSSYMDQLGSELYAFPGRRDHIAERTIYEIVKKYRIRAGLKKKVHPHTLRHSFATHLIENNYPMEKVQMLLGHSSPETTQVYIHTSLRRDDIESPLDSLKLENKIIKKK